MVATQLCDIDVVVLAGGLGTRLGSVLPDLPKVMAPIAGRPFLFYLLGSLGRQGVRRVVLALGSKAEAALTYLKTNSFPGVEVCTVVESQPLGTAGAISFALPWLQSDPVMVMNGDTFVDADLNRFMMSHHDGGANSSVLCCRVQDAGRYGHVEIDAKSRITNFREKVLNSESALVNAGVYLFNRVVLTGIAKLSRGSLERDVLERMPSGTVNAFDSGGRFHDIGTPESMAGAAAFLEAVTA